MTTLADLKAALDAQARDVPDAEDALARAQALRPAHHRALLVAAAVAAALAAAVVVVVLRGGTTAEPAYRDWKTFRTAGFSVRYPPQWRAAQYQVVSSFSTAIVFLSDQPMSDPCTTKSSTRAVTIECSGSAARHLSSGGVSVSWSDYGTPQPGLFAKERGESITVGGVAAKLQFGTGCAGAHSTSVDATVERPGIDNNVLLMSACVAAPRNSEQVALVLQSLQSLRQ